jgi:enoyl-CoA hydratase
VPDPVPPEQVLLVEQLGAVRRLTLNRPAKRNALDEALVEALLGQLADVAGDEGTSVVLLRGAGPSFSAGWDLSAAVGGEHDLRRDRAVLAATGRRMDAVFNCPVPVIAQVHGHCLAGAADLVLHCDLLVVAHDAAIGYPPVRSLGVPSSNMWLYRAGPTLARRMLFTGDTITGDDAVAHELAVSAHPADALDTAALDLAERVARSSRDMLMSNKRVLNMAIELLGRTTLQRFAQAEDALAHVSPDAAAFRREAREGGLAAAFRERDQPFGP